VVREQRNAGLSVADIATGMASRKRMPIPSRATTTVKLVLIVNAA